MHRQEVFVLFADAETPDSSMLSHELVLSAEKVILSKIFYVIAYAKLP